MPMKNIACSMVNRRNRSRLLALLLAVLLLAGCGGQAVTTASPSTTVTPTATASSAPVAGGSLYLPMPEGGSLGNPLLPATREMSSLYGLLYESLIAMDEGGAPSANLAEKWAVSEDGLDWTFTLRQEIAWQGLDRNLDAGDVTFTLDQIKALGADGAYAYVLNYLQSWKANDDGTVTLHLKTPFYGVLHALQFPILPKGAGYNGNSAPDLPVGTGPYVVSSYKKGKSIDFAVNKEWWKKAPYVESINVLPFTDNATQVSSLMLRQLDAVQTDDLTVSQYRESGDANVYEYPTHYFEFLAVNFANTDLKDKRMRQALAWAMDRTQVVAYKYFNHAIVSDTPVPPDSWLYDGKLLHYNQDVNTARKLLAQIGWKDTEGDDGLYDRSPDGTKRALKFTLLVNQDETDTQRKGVAEELADQLKGAGITLEVKALAWDDYVTALGQKQFDLALCGSYLSPVPDYSLLLRSDGALNYGGYGDSEMDTLLDSIVNAPDSGTLTARIADLQTKIIADLPILSLYFRTHSLLTTTKVHNVAGAREDSAFALINQWYIQGN